MVAPYEISYLTPEDREILREVIGDYKRRKQSHGNFEIESDDHHSHDVYLAKIAGTATLPAYGTSPGVGSAELYRPDGTIGTATPQKIGITRDVLNYSDSPIEQDYFPVIREKFGKFLALSGAGDSLPIKSMIMYNGTLDASSRVPDYPQWVKADGVTNSVLNGGSGIDFDDYGVRAKTGTSAPDGSGYGSDTAIVPIHSAADIAAALDDHASTTTGTATGSLTLADHTSVEVADALADHSAPGGIGTATTGITIGSHTPAQVASMIKDHGSANTGTAVTGIVVSDHMGSVISQILADHTGSESCIEEEGPATIYSTNSQDYGADQTWIEDSRLLTGDFYIDVVYGHPWNFALVGVVDESKTSVSAYTDFEYAAIRENATYIRVYGPTWNDQIAAVNISGETWTFRRTGDTMELLINGTPVDGSSKTVGTGDMHAAASFYDNDISKDLIILSINGSYPREDSRGSYLVWSQLTGTCSPGSGSTGTASIVLTIGTHTGEETGTSVTDITIDPHSGSIDIGTAATGITIGSHSGETTGTSVTGITIPAHTGLSTNLASTNVSVEDHSGGETDEGFAGISINDHTGLVTSTKATGLTVGSHTPTEISSRIEDHPGTVTGSGTTQITVDSGGAHLHTLTVSTGNVLEGGANSYVKSVTLGTGGTHTHDLTDPGHTHSIPALTHSGTGSDLTHTINETAHDHDIPGISHSVSDPGHIHSLGTLSHTVYDPAHDHSIPDIAHGAPSDSGHSHSIPSMTHSVNDPTHTHPLTGSGWSHVINDPGHLHTIPDLEHTISQDPHTHLLPTMTHQVRGNLSHHVNDQGHSHSIGILNHTGTSGTGLLHTVNDPSHTHSIGSLSVHTGKGSAYNLTHSVGSLEHSHSIGTLTHTGTGSGLSHGTTDITFKHKRTHYVEKITP